VRKQLITILEKFKLPLITCGIANSKDYSKIKKAITAGFFTHGCRKDPSEGYRTVADN